MFHAVLILLLLAPSAPVPEETLKKAIELHQRGDAEAAIPLYRKYLAVRPGNPAVLSNLGAALAKTGAYDEAATQYKKALQLQPGNPGIQLNLGLAYFKAGLPQQAAVVLEQVHKAAPSELQPVLLLGECWLALGKYDRVVQLLTPVAAQRPDDLGIAYLLGTALIRDKQVERGQVMVDKILRNGNSAEAHMLIGTAKLDMQDYPDAFAELNKAAAISPQLPRLESYRGQALLGTGDRPLATEAFRKALQADPNDYVANVELASLLRDDRQFDEALTLLTRALRVRPKDVTARYGIASVRLAEGQTAAALTELESLVKDAPGYTGAHATLATVYYRLNRKADGDREREVVKKLTAETQRQQQQGINVK